MPVIRYTTERFKFYSTHYSVFTGHILLENISIIYTISLSLPKLKISEAEIKMSTENCIALVPHWHYYCCDPITNIHVGRTLLQEAFAIVDITVTLSANRRKVFATILYDILHGKIFPAVGSDMKCLQVKFERCDQLIISSYFLSLNIFSKLLIPKFD